MLVLHKFLAFPVVDDLRRLVCLVDVNQFTQEVLDIAERERLDMLGPWAKVSVL